MTAEGKRRKCAQNTTAPLRNTRKRGRVFRRLREKDIQGDALQRWLTYFDRGSPGELVAEVIKMDVGIQKAQERLEYVANDEEALREYHMREMALSDWTSGVNYALEEGTKKIARNLKADSVPAEQIAKWTGLSEIQIKEL
jgi:predicted transposase/invertase (TIGR01784 family)